MAIGFVVAIFYYNYLGPEKIGLLAYISVLLVYFGLLSNDIAIHNVAIKHESKTENKKGFFQQQLFLKLLSHSYFFVLL